MLIMNNIYSVLQLRYEVYDCTLIATELCAQTLKTVGQWMKKCYLRKCIIKFQCHFLVEQKASDQLQILQRH